jgi:hypothetical protein
VIRVSNPQAHFQSWNRHPTRIAKWVEICRDFRCMLTPFQSRVCCAQEEESRILGFANIILITCICANLVQHYYCCFSPFIKQNSFFSKHYYCSTLYMQNSWLLIVAKLLGIASRWCESHFCSN